MPELPEVETVVRFIRPKIVGKTIQNIIPQNNYDKVLATHTSQQFNELVAGKSIIDVGRRGKYIVINLNNGFLLIHLRMTGRLLLNLTEDDKPKHLTAIIHFSDKSSLYFKDYRKFGRLYYYESLNYINKKLGVEPLSKNFTKDWLFKNLQNSKRQLKLLLLDQGFIAGLGNIYVDEALWFAKLHPQQIGSSVSRKKSNALHGAVQRLLQTAIDNQGTTIINFYFGEGKSGNFREQLQVFGRHDKNCPRCDSLIEKIRVAQRGTHICPRCQHI
ncbi:DNA-formamidopyrimidine glycosylase [bacterium]|nr:DNA-formamidopyrimidine glycosylase [bacterium]